METFLKQDHGVLARHVLPLQELAKDGGVEALIDRSKRKPNVKKRVDESIEKAYLGYALISLRTYNTALVMNCVNKASSCPATVFALSGRGMVLRFLKSA